MSISLSDRESINFCESGSKERESACHVHREREIKVAVARHELFMP